MKRNFRNLKRVGDKSETLVHSLFEQHECTIKETGCEHLYNKTELRKLRYAKTHEDYLARYRPDKLITTKSGKPFYLEVKSSSIVQPSIGYLQYVWNYFHNKEHPVYYAFVNRAKGEVRFVSYANIKFDKYYISKNRKNKYFIERDKRILAKASEYRKLTGGKAISYFEDSKFVIETKNKWMKYRTLFIMPDITKFTLSLPILRVKQKKEKAPKKK